MTTEELEIEVSRIKMGTKKLNILLDQIDGNNYKIRRTLAVLTYLVSNEEVVEKLSRKDLKIITRVSEKMERSLMELGDVQNTYLKFKNRLDSSLSDITHRKISDMAEDLLSEKTDTELDNSLNKHSNLLAKTNNLECLLNLLSSKYISTYKEYISTLDYSKLSYLLYLDDLYEKLNIIENNKTSDKYREMYRSIRLERIEEANKDLASINLEGKNLEKYNFLKDHVRQRITGEEIKYNESYISELCDIDRSTRTYGPNIIAKCDKSLSFNEDIITIDARGADYLDDALAIKRDGNNYLIAVHIADPSAHRTFNRENSKAYINRSESLYLANNIRLPLFEDGFSKALSLKKDELKSVVSFYILINPDGEILDYNYKEGKIKVKSNLSFDDVTSLLQSNDLSNRGKEELEHIRNLLEVSHLLSSRLEIDKQYKELREAEGEALIGDEYTKEGQQIVSSLMILINNMLAEEFSMTTYPFIYRNHDKREKGKPFTSPYYDLHNKGHAGLKLDSYSHSTSPIRRFTDVVSLLCLKKFILTGEVTDEEYEELKALAEIVAKTSNARSKIYETYHKSKRKIR